MNGSVHQGVNRAEPGRARAGRAAGRAVAGSATGRRGTATPARRALPPEHAVQGNTALQLAVMEAAHFEELTGVGAVAAPARLETPARRRPRLRVAPPLPVAVPRAPFLMVLVVTVVAGVLGVLMINTRINENAFRLGDLKDAQAALDQQEQQLAQRLAAHESPTSLAAAAKRLGLVSAGTPAFIELPNGRTLGVPAPATGTPSVTASGADPATAGATGTGAAG
jgi:hypothetical protein